MPTPIRPEEAVALMREHGLEPLTPYPGSQQPWPCHCTTCGRESSPRFSMVKLRGSRCRHCSGNVAHPAEAAAAFARERGLEPLEPYPGANRPWRCLCLACGKEPTPRYNTLLRSQTGCRYCANRCALDPGAAADVMRSRGLEPLEPYAATLAPWRCRCLSCGAEVTPKYSNVAGGQRGCRYCKTHGFNYAAPALVYLVTHAGYGTGKVGICAAEQGATGRLHQHRRAGWSLHGQRATPTGTEAQRIEQVTLRILRRGLGLPPSLTAAQMPNGYTETFPLHAAPAPAVWSLILSR